MLNINADIRKKTVKWVVHRGYEVSISGDFEEPTGLRKPGAAWSESLLHAAA